MKVALVAEGCYPYVVGGVSSWIHSLIRSFPEVEFSVIAILSNRSQRGKFVYDQPPNLTDIYEVYLQDLDWSRSNRRGTRSDELAWLRLSPARYAALRSLILGDEIDWDGVFQIFQDKKLSVNKLLMSPPFLSIAIELYQRQYQDIAFSDYLWTLRSNYLPLFITLTFHPPKADIYHCVATGYSGIIGSMAKSLWTGARMIVSEHGIYTREREEELIKAKWVHGIYKDIWIQQFRKMSLCAYHYADCVTALFAQAQELQRELGCPSEKQLVTSNGIDPERFAACPGKAADDPFINIGAVLRVTPIKDVKTMINAFDLAKRREPRLKLWIMGPEDEDPQYAAECHKLVETLHTPDVVFTGRIQTTEYLGQMDFTILTSISEGQPLTILEGYSVHKPAIATDVGNCRGLIEGENGDTLGAAGIVTPVMDISAIADAILRLASSAALRRQMGDIGYQRLQNKYRIEYMIRQYQQLYQRLGPGAPPDTVEKEEALWQASVSN